MNAVVESKGAWPNCGCTDTVDCHRHVGMAKQIPARPWKVLEVRDLGPGHYYRFNIDGLNLNWRPEAPNYRFTWSVPNLDSFQYDLSEAVWR